MVVMSKKGTHRRRAHGMLFKDDPECCICVEPGDFYWRLSRRLYCKRHMREAIH